MLVILLFIAQAASEWVEISQQHYRKPVRPNIYSAEVIEEKTYSNHSVIEYNWNKDVHRGPNAGNVQRVQLTNSNVKHITDVEKYGVKNIGLDKGSRDEVLTKDEFVGTVERVPNIGKVKRVQLAQTPVKSPIVAAKSKVNPKVNILGNERNDEDSYKSHTSVKNAENDNDERNRIRKITFVNSSTKQTSEIMPTLLPLKDEKIVAENSADSDDKTGHTFKNYTLIKHLNGPPPTFVTEKEKDAKPNMKPINFKDENKSTVHFISDNVSGHQIKNSNSEIPSLITKETQSNEKNDNFNSKYVTESSFNTKEDRYRTNVPYEEHISQDKVDLNKAVTGNTKIDTIETIVTFMKVVTDTISKNTRRNFNSKLRYLQELKDTILTNIEDRIDATWPDDSSEGTRRRSRSTQETARGHVEFPSSESALMTISFLTFAVFLIKLVLQVIQTYKNKTMMVAPLVVATAGRAAREHLQSHN